MIDTHLHILPGIDDGPETIEEAVALAKALVQEGISAAIATPHYNDVFPRRSAAEIQERVDSLQQVLDHQGVPIRLFRGHEALIKPGMVEDIHTGRLATLNGSRYLLLELWNSSWLPETERVLFELRANGIIPILAHPERYSAFQKETTLLTTLLQQGTLLQITASSLTGKQGRTAQRTAEKLLKQGVVHCIASDAHGMHKRAPHMQESLRRAVQLIGKEKTWQTIEDFPMKVLNDRHIEYSNMIGSM
jgi:protein-tyrosine phosphatase